MAVRALACLTVATLAALPQALCGAEPLRVAVVDAGAQAAAPPELLDLLVVELSEQPGLELLERQQIASILEEQRLSLGMNGGVVAAGKILGAQALVMLGVAPDQQEDRERPLIRVAVVETTRGVRFGETLVGLPGDESGLRAQVGSACKQISQSLGRIKNATNGLTVVSVAGLQTNQLSKEAHRVRRGIEAWLESWLASRPGVAVAERSQVLPLIGERKLASDIPRALGDADATIDGVFEIDFNSSKPTVKLSLRVIRKDRSTATRSLSAPIDDLPRLQQAAGEAAAELLALDAADARFDTSAEAKLLTDEAERLLMMGRGEEARRRLQPAYALHPESYRVQALVLQTGLPRQRDERYTPTKAFYPTSLFVCDAARQVLDKIERGVPAPSGLPLYERESLMRRAFNLGIGMERLRRAPGELSDEEATQNEWLRAAIDATYLRCLDLAPSVSYRSYQSSLLQGLWFSPFWRRTPEEAISLRLDLLRRASELDPKKISGSGVGALLDDHDFDSRLMSRNRSWAHRDDLAELYLGYATTLAASTNPLLRAKGKLALARHHFLVLKDRQTAKKHYQESIDLIVERLIPEYPRIGYDLGGSWLELYNPQRLRLLTDAEAAEVGDRVVRAAWSQGCPRASQPWESRIKATALRFEKSDQPRRAASLLEDCIASLERAQLTARRKQRSSQWPESAARLRLVLAECRGRHPELANDSLRPEELEVECDVCLTIEQLEKEWLEAGLVPPELEWQFLETDNRRGLHRMLRHHAVFAGVEATPSGLAVLGVMSPLPGPKSRASPGDKSRLVIARLDKRGELRSTDTPPLTFSHKDPGFSLHQPHTGTRWPFASIGEDLFAAPPDNGLVHLPAAGKPVHYSSEHLESSDGMHQAAPFTNARQLVACDGKLYAEAGNPIRPTLYSIDPRNKRIAKLFDTASLPADNPLHLRRGLLIMPNPPGRLLIWGKPGGHAARSRPGRRTSDVLIYNLADGTTAEPPKPLYLDHFFAVDHREPTFNGLRQSIGYATPDGVIGVFDPAAMKIDWRVTPASRKPPSTSRIAVGHAGVAVSERRLLASMKKTGDVHVNDWKKYGNVIVKSSQDADFDWLLFTRGKPQPRRLVSPNLPAPAGVRRFFFQDDRHVFMLSDYSACRITLPPID